MNLIKLYTGLNLSFKMQNPRKYGEHPNHTPNTYTLNLASNNIGAKSIIFGGKVKIRVHDLKRCKLKALLIGNNFLYLLNRSGDYLMKDFFL